MWAAWRVWVSVWVVGVGMSEEALGSTLALPSLQSCKAECESHFTNTDLLQAALSATCGRGCDMFTLALITTPQRTRVLHLGPVAMPPHPPPSPPLQRTAPHHLVVKVEERQAGSDASLSIVLRGGEPKSRHTTTQPANDHPVQDLPAHHQPTTTNDPANHHSSDHDTTMHPPSTASSTTTTTTTTTTISSTAPAPTTSTTTTTLTPAVPTHSDSSHHNAIVILATDSQQQDPGAPQQTGQKVGEVVGERERLQQAKDSCRHACATAYQVSAEREACGVGCHLQAATAAGVPRPQSRSPLAYIQHMMVSLAGHVSRLVRVTSSWASGASQPHYQQEQHLMPQHDPQHQQPEPHSQKESHQSQSHHHKQPYHQREAHHAAPGGGGEEQRGKKAAGERQQVMVPKLYYSELLGYYTITGHNVVLPDQHTSHKKKCHHRHVTQTKQERAKPQHDHNHLHQHHQEGTQQQQQQQLDLLECISRKSGLPRWFIAVTIFTSALIILWLCFTLTAPSEDIKVVKTKPPELELDDLDDDFEDNLICAEKKQLLAQVDDIIKIKIENV